jgi:hypothetical protein
MNQSNKVIRHDAHASFKEPIKTVLNEVIDTQDPRHLSENVKKHSKGTLKHFWLLVYARTEVEFEKNFKLFEIENPKVILENLIYYFMPLYIYIYVHVYICMYIYVYISIYTYIYIYVFAYLSSFIYIHMIFYFKFLRHREQITLEIFHPLDIVNFRC